MSGLSHSRDNNRKAAMSIYSGEDMVEYSMKYDCCSSNTEMIRCRRKTDARTASCRHNASGRLYGISHDCRRQILGATLYSILRSCLIGIILITLSSQVSGKTRTDKTPLIYTDELDGDGFRYFMRNAAKLLSELPVGRDIGQLTEPDDLPDYNYEDISFQTVKVIKKWGNDTDLILIGGKDYVYMLDDKFTDGSRMITYREKLTWSASSLAKNRCLSLPGQPDHLCENFIRFIELLDNGLLMVCGTNAYSPVCRYYKREQFNAGDGEVSVIEEECRDQCFVPHNPTFASVSLYTNTDNGYQIFASVINDFNGNDPIIMRKDKPTLWSNPLWLKEPTFLKIMEYQDKVYIFFRETAEVSESGTSEKVIYARVAQVCKNDPGGMYVLAQQWTTFLKARLRCGYAERQHLQFDNLTSVSDIATISDTREGEMDVFFATFTTPWEWADSSISAICAYSMQEIAKLFDSGRFFDENEFELRPLSSRDMRSMPRSSTFNGGPYEKLKRSYVIDRNGATDPRHGSCGTSYTANDLSFAKKHPLMYDSAIPLSSAPLHVFHDLRASQISLDNDAGNNKKLMLYVGTENAKVLRLRVMSDQKKVLKTALLETISAEREAVCVSESCSIRALHVSRPVSNGVKLKPYVFVAFTNYMVQFPVARCGSYGTKQCCSVDPDCGWDGDACILRTPENNVRLAPTSLESYPLPDECSGGRDEARRCRCDDAKNKGDEECEEDKTSKPNNDDPFVVDPALLELAEEDDVNMDTILQDSISTALRNQFQDTLVTVRGVEQRAALKRQLKEAIASTVGLVLKNHRQEYCLPSPAVNHLTHVYPLLIREIELWHETALRKMSETPFDPKCWADQKKCPERVSFSLPLLPMLWEPLTKLIQNFSGHCEIIDPGKEAASFRPRPRTQCTPLPGLEPCKDVRQPHCKPMRCQFPEYAVDAKAFFRHANDSRYFLAQGTEPLWKLVNVTIPQGESIKGHLEVVVSDGKPFMIDYSPVAEKVKISFHYRPVRDCALTESDCVGQVTGCDTEVEDIINHWFKWVMGRMSHRMRKCTKEINRSMRKSSRRKTSLVNRRTQAVNLRDRLLDDSTAEFNRVILVPQDKCKRVVGKVPNLLRNGQPQPVSRNVWALIASRCQRSGGIYSMYEQTIEFYHLRDVIQFFKNTCTFAEPSTQRGTFTKRTKRRSRSPIYVQPMVTSSTPFVIQRNGDKITMRYFVTEAPSTE